MAGGNITTNVKLKGDILSFPVAIATAIYRGTCVALNAAGYLIQASDAASITFVGIAEESVTAAQAVANGTVSVRVRRHGIFKMVKNTTSLVGDLGKFAYMHTGHSSSVQELVGLAAACTNDIPIGLIVSRATDKPGGATYASNYLMVDITPAINMSLASAVSTHAGLSGQDAHTANAIQPVTAAVTTGNAISAANFIGGVVTLSSNGTSTHALPTTGVTAGTVCRIVKTGSIGLVTLTAATGLTGIQTVSNAFYGMANVGDSVEVMCTADATYVVIACNQRRPLITGTGATEVTVTAAQVAANSHITQANGSAVQVTLPAAAAGNCGSSLIVTNLGAGAVTVFLTGNGASGDVATLAIYQSCYVESNGTVWSCVNNSVVAGS
jgi:hypothetical protein